MTEKVQLPEGWKWTTLGEISNAQSGVGFPKQFQGLSSGDYPLVKVSDISESAKRNGGIIHSAKNYLAASIAKKIGAKVFPVGTTLFAKIGEAIRLNRRAINSLPILADNNVMGLIPKIDEVTPKYLFKYMHSVDLYKYSQATTVPSVRKSDIEQIQIPLPPLDEQERIVAKIESLFSQLDAGVAALQHIRAALKRYKASVLKAAFEGRLVPQDIHNEPVTTLLKRILGSNYAEKIATSELSDTPFVPPGWTYGKLENLIYIAGRIGWRGLKAEEYTLEGPLFLSVFNLNKGDYVDFTNGQHISNERYEESPEIKLQENDILLTKDGAGIGKIGIVKNLPGNATVNSSLLVIRASEVFIPEFLFYFLKGPQMQDIVRARISGSATPHLFQRDIKQFTLLIPPLVEQQRIVSEIEQRLSVISEVETMVADSLTRASHLRQAILKKAFEGRLVTQNDSP